MIQFLLPLLGSLGGGALASSIGGGLLTKALLTGGGSFLGSKLSGADTDEALMSGLLGGAFGGLSGLMGQGAGGASGLARAATEGTKAVGAAAGTAGSATGSLANLMANPIADIAGKGVMGDPKLLGGLGATAAQAPTSMGGMARGAMDFVRRNPGTALTGAGLLASMLPNAPPVPTGGTGEDIPENFPNGPGPQRGYQRANMTSDQYRNYGVAGGPAEGEFAFFEESRPGQGPGGPVTGGIPGVVDSVPAISNTGQPHLLNRGEYVLPVEMVNAIGLPALERMRRMYV